MKVLTNNCVETVQVPECAKSGHKVAYNPIVDLYVTMNLDDGISAWNPVTGMVFGVTDFGVDGCLDFVLVPGSRLAMSYSEAHHGGVIQIYSLKKLSKRYESKPVLKLKRKPDYPGKMALSPQNSLLVNDAFDFSDIWNIFIDWDNLKEYKVSGIDDIVMTKLDEEYRIIDSLCCTPDYEVVEGILDENSTTYSRSNDAFEFSYLLVGKKCQLTQQISKEGKEKETQKTEERRSGDADEDSVESVDDCDANDSDVDDSNHDNDNDSDVDDSNRDDNDNANDSDVDVSNHDGDGDNANDSDVDDSNHDNDNANDSDVDDSNRDDNANANDSDVDDSNHDDYDNSNDSDVDGSNHDDYDNANDSDVDDSNHDGGGDDNADNNDVDDSNHDGSDNDDDNKDEIEYGGGMDIKRHVLDHCILDGVEYKLQHTTEFVHDGHNLIVADADKILLLETLTNGSIAHLIASGLKPECKGLGINHKGQLMVCDSYSTIKIFEYRCIPRSLQDLCRCCILEAIPNDYSNNVKKVLLPEIMKDYLLFQDKGY